jgi:hypothetical protein
MKFMLMMNTRWAPATASIERSADDLKAHVGFMKRLNGELSPPVEA